MFMNYCIAEVAYKIYCMYAGDVKHGDLDDNDDEGTHEP